MNARPGFFIPYRYAEAIRPVDYPALESLFSSAGKSFTQQVASLSRYATEFAAFGGPAPAPRFEQDWFPRLDACLAYSMIRDQRPSKIVEIGCGHSTRVMARATMDGGLVVDHVCIDPSPRAHLTGLAVRHLNETVDRVDPAIFARIASGDVLFVDSSHIAMPGSDVDLLINDVLPRLPSGSILHFHDIFLPFAYPAHWQWRGYNEQLLLAAMLSNGRYEILFSSAYVTRCMIDLLRHSVISTLALPEGALESSLWLRKRTAP